MASKSQEALVDPLFNENPITLQVLGICSALAVTTRMDTSLVMSIAVICVLTLSNVFISIPRQRASRFCRASTRVMLRNQVHDSR